MVNQCHIILYRYPTAVCDSECKPVNDQVRTRPVPTVHGAKAFKLQVSGDYSPYYCNRATVTPNPSFSSLDGGPSFHFFLLLNICWISTVQEFNMSLETESHRARGRRWLWLREGESTLLLSKINHGHAHIHYFIISSSMPSRLRLRNWFEAVPFGSGLLLKEH